MRTAAAVAPVTRSTEAARRGGDRARELAAVGRLTKQAATLQRRGLDALDALQPPSADQDAFKGWIAGLRRRAVALDGLGDAYTRGSQALIAERAERAEVLREDAQRFAQRYGLRACVAFP